jgi:hypothetical protein
MASRRIAIADAWRKAQDRDLVELPHEARLDRPGAYGTHAERTRGSVPKAPTLDNGPLYTGEDREEINGEFTTVADPSSTVTTLLASTRRPWPYIAFALDTSNVPALTTVRAGVVLLTRSGPVRLVGNLIGGAPPPVPELTQTGVALPFPWICMTGIYVGARVAIFATQTFAGEGEAPELLVRANLWGYNAPGFGP